MNFEELIKDLDAISVIEFKNYLTENITEICTSKNSISTILSNNNNTNFICDKCGYKIHKNGKTKNGIQKYICSNCKKTFSQTTNTVLHHSKLSVEVWLNIIDNLINGFSIRRIAEENNISNNTSFNARHKIITALNSFIKEIALKGDVQSDEKYFSINLKGTKPKNMPRYSKKRVSTKSQYTGISHHKICVVSSIDEYDNLILKIAGLGRCTTKMLEDSIGSKIENVININADSASAYQKLCKDHKINLRTVPSGFHSDGIINIAEINGVHSQLETWLKKFRGTLTIIFELVHIYIYNEEKI